MVAEGVRELLVDADREVAGKPIRPEGAHNVSRVEFNRTARSDQGASGAVLVMPLPKLNVDRAPGHEGSRQGDNNEQQGCQNYSPLR